jgi:hypothetical protein
VIRLVRTMITIVLLALPFVLVGLIVAAMTYSLGTPTRKRGT